MQTVEIHGEVREASGKGGARSTRRAGKTPGVLYGGGEKPLPISLETRGFENILRKHAGGAFVLDLKLGGHEDRDLKAIIKEMQRDPITSKVLHVDLLHISMTQMIHVSVPIHVTGTAIGVKEGGILEQFLREVEIECQAARIPERIDVDVTKLSKHQSIHAGDLVFEEGVRLITPADRVIVLVAAKAAEETPAAAAAEAAPAADAKAPEAEAKG